MPVPGPTARNLCLHYVTPGASRRRLALSREALRALVAREREEGRSPASLADYVGEGAPGGDRFTLSFDDAHVSVRDHALPVLQALGVTATVFVPTGYVGMGSEFMTWDDLRALRDAGWSLGAHSVTHPRMSWRIYDETPEALARRLADECARARDTMVRELGVQCPLFAYPYGESPESAREAVRAGGYTAAFTVREGTDWDGDLLAVPRVDGMEAHGHITAASAEPTGISVVVPCRDRVDILRVVVGALAGQSYPAERYEVLVVDDGSREDLAPLFVGMPENVKLVQAEGGDGGFRAGQARQRGADRAVFPVVAFLDADVVVGRDYLWHLDWIHQRTPGAVVLGYLSGYNLHDLGHVHTAADARAVTDIEHLSIIPDRSREPTLRGCMDNLDWLDDPWKLAYTGNLSLPRELLSEVGGFAEEYEGWGLEDVDLGYRLHRAGARWVFSRFAVGWHLVDPSEPVARNPFRRMSPVRDDFVGYTVNLDTLRRRHPRDPEIMAYHRRALDDIDETVGHPDTVGIELGGECTLNCAFHTVINRCQPGGVTVHEALDRVAYAAKVGARAVYLLGGEPGEHPGFLTVVRAAKSAGVRHVGAQTNAVPFAREYAAREARDAGLDHVTVKVFAFDSGRYDAVVRRRGTYERFLAGWTALAAAGIHRSARVVVTRETVGVLEDTLRTLATEGVRVDEVGVIDPSLLPRAREIAGSGLSVAIAGP